MAQEFTPTDPAGQKLVDNRIFDCSEIPAGGIDHPEMLWHDGIPCLSWGLGHLVHC
ncbi:hypothetical protein [Mesorhizobium waimense]|uniref:hypothetical protein n=1 Tax=Mesorhizobium waimense TaxID=1300307 RepID=UPI001FE1C524|nr:hypothetical protein [Mesorhizobium waimense]